MSNSERNALNESNLENDERSLKILRKRRSSVFQIRNIEFKDNEDVTESTSKEPEDSPLPEKCQCVTNTAEEEVFNLPEYIESLKEERKMWENTWKERRNRRRYLAKQKVILETKGQDMDLSILSDSDRAFLMARPDYQQICKNTEKLVHVAVKVSVLNQLVHKLHDRFIMRMQEKLCDVTKQVIKMSES